ncbi:MAG: hypothetical protein E7Z78_04365 [Methanobrevibacter thaueri]|jgi:hypothetical protein|uniref:hypothetical protein n=1 Tax=Methanobrevibacter thaueri TaxID=190975 RepID=UPI0026EA0285|nr:hypothetical protein [Methanobrevibacter thaueri]MBE6495659.1 hypothetical protein [Methanobrevibacter thaueri]
MYGEIDLESYTLSIIRLNTALQKLEDNGEINEIRNLLEESHAELEKLYKDIVDDLNQDEINVNEYYLFFQNGKQTFPQYIEILGNIENSEINDVVMKLINVFRNLNKIADAFKG